MSLTAAHPVMLGAMYSDFFLSFLLSLTCLPTDSSAFKKSEYEASMKKMQKQLTNVLQHIGQLEQRLVDDARQRHAIGLHVLFLTLAFLHQHALQAVEEETVRHTQMLR